MKSSFIVGIDEVGRGPVAGPVAVCVCAIDTNRYRRAKWKGLTDSKKMTPKSRLSWYREAQSLQDQGVISYEVIFCPNTVIDKKGISFAIRYCIDLGIKKLSLDPADTSILLDGSLRAPVEFKNQKTIIKGDQKEKIISLASVIAKVTRDMLMVRLSKKYPEYNWSKNKGYGTREHYQAIKKYGLTPLHRKTFLGDKK